MKIRGATLHGAAVAAAAVLVYLNTLQNGLVVDDVHQILQNDWITGPEHLGTVFTHGVWDFEGRASSYYRPLMYVLYMGAYAIAGHAAWAYHLLNVLLHAGVTVFVFLLGREVLPRESRAPALLCPPFLAALFFAVHPIHTESVAWPAGIADLGLALFALIALWGHATAAHRGWPRDILAAVAWFLALLCKETAVVVPVLAATFDFIFVGRERRWHRLTWGLAPWLGAALVYLVLRVNALGGLMPTAGDVNTHLTFSTYVLSVVTLLADYLQKLVLPVGLNFWHAFQPPASMLSAAALRAVAIVGLAGAVSWTVFANRAARYAIVLIVVPLLPTFHLGALNQGLENAFAERYLYLPSVGFVLLLALAVETLRARSDPRAGWVLALVLAVTGTYATATVARNRVWKDHLTLWSDAVRKSPGSAVAHMNYGSALIYAGRSAEGTAEMRRAWAMKPDLVDRELAKATAYLAKGLHMKALLTLHTALALDPQSAAAHFNLGLVYEARGDADAATAEYLAAISLKPDYAEAHNNLGILYAVRGDRVRAAAQFREAVRLKPGDPDYRANLARAEAR